MYFFFWRKYYKLVTNTCFFCVQNEVQSFFSTDASSLLREAQEEFEHIEEEFENSEDDEDDGQKDLFGEVENKEEQTVMTAQKQQERKIDKEANRDNDSKKIEENNQENKKTQRKRFKKKSFLDGNRLNCIK